MDINQVFNKAIDKPKITGIAGDVIEQSVLGYPADNKQEPDLIVDGLHTELKTTGLRKPKRLENSDDDKHFIAKEGVSITAVSPENITSQEFEDSYLWHKMEYMLFVFYHYNSYKVVPAYDYSTFKVLGHHFHEFSDEDKEIIFNDWKIVRDKVEEIQSISPNPKEEYPSLTKLRSELMYFDLAPKRSPRFRLKKDVVNVIIGEFFNKKLEKLNRRITSYSQLDLLLHNFTELFKGKTLKEIATNLSVELPESVSKNIVERIITKFFGSEEKKLRKIDIFSKIGLIPKTVVLNPSGGRTEDMKFDRIDFEEWFVDGEEYEDSNLYDFFYNHKFLFVIFKEPEKDSPLLENQFVGFKRYSFTDDFIENDLKPYYDELKRLIVNKEIREEPVSYKTGVKKGQLIINPSGTVKTEINLPKSKDYLVFTRGSGIDSSKKPVELNGVKMYAQYFWIKGKWIVKELENEQYI
ncbi:MAG TPA: restriction endonuclease [Sporosarcina psychrophila]|uniref:Restriction endonuclease n=1 Tax=Sporosarcina psychrophila TaxID=1476 RepID=A0A921G1V5_SPOPS|nr:restriction endonuclease [Sporosarcina psychrophila]